MKAARDYCESRFKPTGATQKISPCVSSADDRYRRNVDLHVAR